MDQALGLGLNAIPFATQHYDKVWDPIHHKYKKARGRVPKDDPNIYEMGAPEEKGLVLRRRRDVASDEEIVEVVRHKGEILPKRPGQPRRRASSMNNARAGAAGAGAGAGAGAMVPYRDRRNDYSDSEGSVPPRSRVRAKSQSGRSQQSRRRRGSSSSSSSLASSTEEEKNCKKLARKKWITAGLASVATIHAASKVYSSIEKHDQRIQKVNQGEISPEEAHKQQRAARWQDAAAIAIAALGIKGAVSEWNEVQEEHREHRELLEQREEHHKKRLERERRKQARDQGGYYKGRDGQWYYSGPQPQSSESRRGGGGGGGGGGNGGRGNYDDSRSRSRAVSRGRNRYDSD
ncbi:hypothetical protein EDD37DRAFT_696942 [Exophiala viscosa]|uniref:Uncharacterized protein n=1 Tax=Exophiala viscosa TaxID=2486360 RepID=A0AAN6DZF1_9EURO|nr:hypothetical protein EDD36DRAFT_224791 [Exophiala viscosa]KAI1621536.1 hypothetical protein EDD37DRAFT_696942 [Exophiala viscosa]